MTVEIPISKQDLEGGLVIGPVPLDIGITNGLIKIFDNL